MKVKYLNIISDENDIISDSHTLNISFSKTTFKKYKDKSNIEYFFDIDAGVKEYDELSMIEDSLSRESLDIDNRWYYLSYKYIYKYLVTYNQFYNRLSGILKKNKGVETLIITSNITFILSRVLSALKEKHSIVIENKNNKGLFFSYRHFRYMGSDIPVEFNIDRSNIFLYLIAIYLRVKGHVTFMFPSSCKHKESSKTNIFKTSYFGILSKIKRILLPPRKNITLRYFPIIDFSVNIPRKYKLTNKYWDNFRADQIDLINSIINIYFNHYNFKYLDLLEKKTMYLISATKTKRIIFDDTSDSYRKLTLNCCNKLGVDAIFLPHGIIDEEFQFPSIKNPDYLKHLPAVTAWNKNSSDYFTSHGLKSIAISFPLNMSKKIVGDKKDVLVMLSHGNRINLNSFEDDIESLMPLITELNQLVDWKIHQNIFDEANKAMSNQILYLEKTHGVNLNFIDHNTRSSSIMNNYRKIVFTTWTTGIFEAAMLNIPFIVFTKEKYNIHALNAFNMPIAQNLSECIDFILEKEPDMKYLEDIRKSLHNNTKLDEYLELYD